MKEKFSGKRQEQCIATILFIGLIFILIPLLWIAGYDVPSIDDFAYANMSGYSFDEHYTVGQILWMEIKNSYIEWKTWQGLYSSNFISFVVNALFMRDYYYLTTWLSLGLLVVSELIAGVVILQRVFGCTKEQAVIFTIPCVVLQVLLIPSPAEAFYWMCGAVIYTTMQAVAFIYFAELAVLLCSEKVSKGKRVFLKLTILFGTFMVGGSNFITIMMAVGIGGSIVLYALWKKHKERRFLIGNYIFLIACVFLCIISPGTMNRQEGAGAHSPALEAILRSFAEAFSYIKTWTILPVGLLILFMIPVAWRIVSVRKFRYPLPLLFSLWTFCLYAMLFTPNLYALGIIGAYRIQNMYRISLYILLFVNLLYWVGYFRRVWTSRQGRLKVSIHPLFTMSYFAVAGCVVGLLILYYGGSTVSSVSALRSLRNGTAKDYYDTYQERLMTLCDESVKDVVLEPYVDAPYVLFFGDIKGDASAWENVAMAEYFKKNSVILKE